MAEIFFSKDEVARLLEDLIQSEALRVAARSRDGQPLFDAADVRRAAEEFALAAREMRRRHGKGKAAAR